MLSTRWERECGSEFRSHAGHHPTCIHGPHSDVVSLVKISKEMYDEAKEFDEKGTLPMLEPAINARIQRAAKARQNTR